MTQHWLNCEITKGMFSDEVTVVIRAHDGEKVAAFVPRDRVDGHVEERGRVKVRVFENVGRRFAVLPNESQTVVDVDDSQLAVA